jgi:hypothetical protein
MVTRTQAEVTLLVVLLAGAWLAFGRGVPSPLPPGGAPRQLAPLPDDPVGGGLAARTRSLHAYLSAPPPASTLRRNPFSFVEPPRPAAARRAAVTEDAQTPPPRPPLVLSGIAEDSGAAGVVRTAVIKAAGAVVFAKEGDRVLSRFVVERIAPDAVQLRDTERGDVFTLALK